jgi:Spx/MgsR family transcriptional regulator
MNIYGIKNCDTCRKALRFLEEGGIDHDWHDLRDDGIDVATLQRWVGEVGADTLVNRRSTTWRGLSEAERVEALSAIGSAAFLADHPTLIKRPVFEIEGAIHVGFKADVQDALKGLKS